MINNEIIEKIKGIDEEYVISGSNATMLYVGYDIRECKDIDLHLSKRVSGEEANKVIGIKTDISYESFPYQIYNGIRLVKLEKLIADKINRLNSKPRCKDIYDLYFLLDSQYDKTVLSEYLEVRDIDMIFVDKNKFNDFVNTTFFSVGLYDCLNKIKEHIKLIYQ